MQDASLQESMGPIVDRSLEHLTSSDIAIVRARRRLLGILNEVEEGRELSGIDLSSQQVRSAAIYLPNDVTLAQSVDEISEALKVQKGVSHASV
jgi:hypothetical protein